MVSFQGTYATKLYPRMIISTSRGRTDETRGQGGVDPGEILLMKYEAGRQRMPGFVVRFTPISIPRDRKDRSARQRLRCPSWSEVISSDEDAKADASRFG